MINWVWEGKKSGNNCTWFTNVNKVVQGTFENTYIGRRICVWGSKVIECTVVEGDSHDVNEPQLFLLAN